MLNVVRLITLRLQYPSLGQPKKSFPFSRLVINQGPVVRSPFSVNGG